MGQDWKFQHPAVNRGNLRALGSLQDLSFSRNKQPALEEEWVLMGGNVRLRAIVRVGWVKECTTYVSRSSVTWTEIFTVQPSRKHTASDTSVFDWARYGLKLSVIREIYVERVEPVKAVTDAQCCEYSFVRTIRLSWLPGDRSVLTCYQVRCCCRCWHVRFDGTYYEYMFITLISNCGHILTFAVSF